MLMVLCSFLLEPSLTESPCYAFVLCCVLFHGTHLLSSCLAGTAELKGLYSRHLERFHYHHRASSMPHPSPSCNKPVEQERENPWCVHPEPAPSEGASWFMGLACSEGGWPVECSPHVTRKQGDTGKDVGARF